MFSSKFILKWKIHKLYNERTGVYSIFYKTSSVFLNHWSATIGKFKLKSLTCNLGWSRGDNCIEHKMCRFASSAAVFFHLHSLFLWPLGTLMRFHKLPIQIVCNQCCTWQWKYHFSRSSSRSTYIQNANDRTRAGRSNTKENSFDGQDQLFLVILKAQRFFYGTQKKQQNIYEV